MKHLLIGLLALTSLNTFAAITYDEMIDGLSDDAIAKVNNKLQIVDIKGPNDLKDVKAVLLKPDTENGKALLMIAGRQGVRYVSLIYTQNLDITLAGNGNDGRETTLETNSAGSLIIKNQNGSGREQFTSKLTFAFRDNDYVLAGFDYNVFDNGTLKRDTCSYDFLSGKGMRNNKNVLIQKQKLLLSDITEDQAIANFSSCNLK